jgi:hypothetical protein
MLGPRGKNGRTYRQHCSHPRDVDATAEGASVNWWRVGGSRGYRGRCAACQRHSVPGGEHTHAVHLREQTGGLLQSSESVLRVEGQRRRML